MSSGGSGSSSSGDKWDGRKDDVRSIREKWDYTDSRGRHVDYRSDVISRGPKPGTHTHDWYEVSDRGVQEGTKTSKNK